MKKCRILLGLGLCAKAGKLVYGVPLICESIRRGKIFLVAEASDTSANTNKRLSDKCAFYKTERIKLEASGEELASAVGKGGSLGAVGITDSRLAQMIKEKLEKTSADEQ